MTAHQRTFHPLEQQSFIRAITCMALASNAKGDTNARAASLMSTHWGEDSRAGTILRAAVDPPPGLAYGFPAIPAWELLPLLAPAAASMRLLARARSLNLAGVTHITVPTIPFSGRPAPVFVAEAQPAPVIQFHTHNDVVLGPVKKILVQASLTHELELASANTAQELISEALKLATAQSMDATLFSTNASTASTPAGILAGVAPIAGSATATGADAIAADVGAIADQISQAGINPDEMILITSPKCATKLKTLVGPKFNYEIFTSYAIPSDTVIGVAPEALILGYDGSVQFDVSREVAVHYDDTAPLQIASGGTMASPIYSAFQQDLIVIRLRAKAAWTVQSGGVAWAQTVKW
jgi:hypothetical protein